MTGASDQASSSALAAADACLRAGDVAGARSTLVEAIRRAPSDQGARMFLFQLLCVAGEWEKAEAQLRTLAQLSPEAQMLATVYAQAIAAERVRAAAFAGQAPFAVHPCDAPWMADVAAALEAFARGDVAQGEAHRDLGFGSAPDTPGDADGRAFAWIADADPRFGPALELILHGRWGLLPFAAIETIAFEGPADLRDVVWAPVQLRLRTGLSAAAFVPTRYPGSETGPDSVKLARETVWRTDAAGDAGMGQRLFAFDSGEDAGLLSLSTLSFR